MGNLKVGDIVLRIFPSGREKFFQVYECTMEDGKQYFKGNGFENSITDDSFNSSLLKRRADLYTKCKSKNLEELQEEYPEYHI